MDIGLISPELSLVITTIIVILLGLFVQNKIWLTLISLAGLTSAAGFILVLWGDGAQTTLNNMLVIDNFALFFKLFIVVITAMVILASIDYFPKFTRFIGEYHALVLLAAIGMMFMVASNDFISIFVALELTAISFYALVGLLKNDSSTEASLKFVLLGGIASAVLLYGMALIFGFTGETQLLGVAHVIHNMHFEKLLEVPGLAFGLVLVIAGFGFKIASVPFQMWAPDVYEGAPTSVTLYLSAGSKIAAFAVIIRVFFYAFGSSDSLSHDWGIIFAVLSIAGMTLGNILAIQQVNIKRLLAYSGIAHSGYILIGLATIGISSVTDFAGQSNVLFYVIAFASAELAAFISVIAISNKTNSDLIKDYAGIGKRSPFLSLALTFGLISLIGLPPTAGFMAKFYIFTGAANSGLLWLVIVAVINSVISAYYYLRVVKVMWFDDIIQVNKKSSSTSLKLVLFISCLVILVMGVVPTLLIKLVDMATLAFP